MRYGGRRRNVSFAHAQAAHILIEDFGISLAEVARNLGVTTSAIFNMLKKNGKFNYSRTYLSTTTYGEKSRSIGKLEPIYSKVNSTKKTKRVR